MLRTIYSFKGRILLVPSDRPILYQTKLNNNFSMKKYHKISVLIICKIENLIDMIDTHVSQEFAWLDPEKVW